MQPKIDFHGLWIAPPKAGQALPRLRADGLGLEIGLSGTAKISGTVVRRQNLLDKLAMDSREDLGHQS
jgi:hypothetical protein